MPYKNQLIILFFLLVSSFSFSAKAIPDENSIDCAQHQSVGDQSEIFKEKVIMMSREFENK
ncbi:hypothetical protein [Halobacteriovorax sp.]|uniref:hypothetical protein n=1 Tax=Halobacteriovorax sp. TaxID=2020862 RepID=UPI003565C152